MQTIQNAKYILFAEAIDVEKLAIIIANAKAIVSDTDSNNKIITGSKKKKIQAFVGSLSLTSAQKYMVMGYLGYKNTVGESVVKNYINRLSLTNSVKTMLLQYSGY